MITRVVVLLITTLVVAEGCSGSAEEGSAAPGMRASSSAALTASVPIISDPCKLLTREEASAAIGQRLVRSDLQNYGPATRCRFFNEGGDEPLWLDAEDVGLFEAHTHDSKPVGGIGDRALWQHDERDTFVHILKGGKMVSMGLPRTLATLTPEVEKAAKLVASRM